MLLIKNLGGKKYATKSDAKYHIKRYFTLSYNIFSISYLYRSKCIFDAIFISYSLKFKFAISTRSMRRRLIFSSYVQSSLNEFVYFNPRTVRLMSLKYQISQVRMKFFDENWSIEEEQYYVRLWTLKNLEKVQCA